MPTCNDCKKDLAKAYFSKNQLRKEPSGRRCKACITANPGNGNSEGIGNLITNRPIDGGAADGAFVNDPISESSPKIPETEEEMKIKAEEGTDEGTTIDCEATNGDSLVDDDPSAEVVVDTPLKRDNDRILIDVVPALVVVVDTPVEIDADGIVIDVVPDTLEISDDIHEYVEEESHLIAEDTAGLTIAEVADLTSVPTEEVTYHNEILLDQGAIGSDAPDRPKKVEDSEVDDVGIPQAPSFIRIGICAMDKKSRSKPMVSLVYSTFMIMRMIERML